MRELLVCFGIAFVLLGVAGYASLGEKPDVTPLWIFLATICGYSAVSLALLNLLSSSKSRKRAFCMGVSLSALSLVFGNTLFVGFVLNVTARLLGLGREPLLYVMIPVLVLCTGILTALLSDIFNVRSGEKTEQRDQREVAEPDSERR